MGVKAFCRATAETRTGASEGRMPQNAIADIAGKSERGT
jgi:hypothetical protein